VAKRRKQKRQLSRGAAAVEDRRAEVITVAWMLAAMATLGAEVVGGLLRIMLNQLETASAALLTFPNLMLFTAAVTGILCLSLTPLVYHFRRVPPPTGVTAFAVTISVIPLAIAGVQTLR
jgi:hypothetical protein